MSLITIIGAGQMASALTYPLTDNGHTVRLVGTPLDDAIIDGLKKDLKHANDNINTVNDKCAELEAENAKLKKTVAPAAAALNVETVVFFEKNVYELSAFGEAVLSKYVASVKNSDNKISIVGHADNTTGSKEYNEKISQKRAEAVKAFIVANGIDESRIEVKWEGDSSLPFADGDAEVNRCVVIK